MPLLFSAILTLGFDDALSWRIAMVVPGIVLLLVGFVYYKYTADCPDGNYDELRKNGQMELPGDNRVAWDSFLGAAKDYRVWILFAIYGACFGVEITFDNIAAIYFFDQFHLDLKTAGLIAGLFGLMNIFPRSLGGVFSDRFAPSEGVPGRVRCLFLVLCLEGFALILFSHMGALVTAIPAMLLFSLFVKMSNGATYGLVPFVNRKALGAVAGIVGAGGNAGAVLAGFLFKSEALTYQQGLFYLGVAVVLISFSAISIRFSPEKISQENENFATALTLREAEYGTAV